jgi:hypothetical protein
MPLSYESKIMGFLSFQNLLGAIFAYFPSQDFRDDGSRFTDVAVVFFKGQLSSKSLKCRLPRE